MNYSYSYGYADDSALVATLFGIFGVVFLVALAVGIFMLVVTWKLYKKAGKPGWAAIVPFYNQYVLAEITWGNGWFFLIFFASIIPIVGSIAVLIFMVMTYIKLAKAFGKDGGFALGLIFLNPVFLAILALGKSEYVGVDGNINPFSNTYNNANNNNYQNNNLNNMNYNNTYNNNYQNNNYQNDNQGVVNNNQVNNTNLRFCTNCGTKIESNALYCTNCGTKVN